MSYHNVVLPGKTVQGCRLQEHQKLAHKEIKSNLCLTNVFIHVSGCRHGLSLHTELRSDALYKILINKPLAQCAGS